MKSSTFVNVSAENRQRVKPLAEPPHRARTSRGGGIGASNTETLAAAAPPDAARQSVGDPGLCSSYWENVRRTAAQCGVAAEDGADHHGENRKQPAAKPL